ncbi:MAG TPA: PAS domain S-box protein [bacterium]|nr:PAS domain S-box protein [bacterium]
MNVRLPKLFLRIFLPLVALIVIITAAIYYAQMKSAAAATERQEVNTIEFNKNEILREFDSVVSDLMLLSENQHLHKYLKAGGESFLKELEIDFFSLSSRRKLYDQLRFLDETGMEIVRIDFRSGEPQLVPEDQLQNKSGRYYFSDTLALESGDVYVSPFDLNIERGQIENPLKPMIRFGTPVFDQNGQKRGIVLLNYLGFRLLNRITSFTDKYSCRIALVNSAGYWLKGFESENEWGFMYEDRMDRVLGNEFPQAWEKMTETESGQFYTSKGLFTFSSVYPLQQVRISSGGSGEAYYWKILAWISSDQLYWERWKILRVFLLFSLFMLIVIAPGSWFLAKTNLRRKEAERALQESYNALELRVKERTTELNRANARLRQEVEEHLRAKEALRESEQKYRFLVENAEEAIFIDQDDVIKFPNPKAEELTGYSLEELADKPFIDLVYPEDRDLVHGRYTRGLNGEDITKRYSYRIVMKDNEVAWVDVNAVLVSWEARPAVLVFLRDITHQKKLESQLVQAQKMESIGTLAGGIAHDFNNILTPIHGYAELTLCEVPKEDSVHEYMKQILDGARRAKELVLQILSFSRQTDLEQKPVRMQSIVKESLKLLRSSIPTTIEIDHNIDVDSGLVLGNPTQLHQILLNLCTMPWTTDSPNPVPYPSSFVVK